MKSPRSSHALLVFAIVVAAAGLILGGRALVEARAGARASGSVGREAVTPPGSGSGVGSPEVNYAPIDRNEIVGAVQAATLPRPELSGGQVAALAEIVADVLAMYNEGSIEEYDRFIAERGLAPPSGWDSAKTAHQESASLGFDFLRGAEVAAGDALVRLRSPYPDNQHEQEQAPIGHGMTEASIPERAVKGVPVYEVVVPARTWSREIRRSPAGSLEIGGLVRVEGRVALLLQWNENTRSWVPIAIRSYGESRSDALPMLPPP